MIQMNIQMEEMRRDRYEGRERSLHSFSRYRSPHASTCSSAWKLSEPHAIRTFMEASSRKRDPSLTPPGTRPHPGAHQHCLRTKDTPITQEITRVSEVRCQGPGQRQNVRTGDASGTRTTQELTRAPSAKPVRTSLSMQCEEAFAGAPPS